MASSSAVSSAYIYVTYDLDQWTCLKMSKPPQCLSLQLKGGKNPNIFSVDCQCSLKLLDCLDTSFWIEPAAFTPFFWYCYFTPYSCQKRRLLLLQHFPTEMYSIKRDVTVFFFYSEWQIKFWFFCTEFFKHYLIDWTGWL